MESLIGAIELVKSKVKEHREYYERVEEAVKQQLVFEILEALGWDIKNPDEVRPEDKTEMGRADYALRLNGRVVAYIEAKNLSINVLTDKNALKQLGNYCFGKGVNYGILTNGIQWKVIKAFEIGKSIEERVLFSVDLEKDSIHRGAFLLSLLAKDRIKKLEETSKTFRQLEDSFTALKAFGFSEDQIFRVLSKRKGIPPEVSAHSHEPSGTTLLDNAVKISELKDVAYTKPIGAFVKVGGEWKELNLLKNTWRELLRRYAEFVVDTRGRLPLLPGYIVTDKSELKNWNRRGGTKSFIQVGSYYLYVWLSANEILRVLKKLQDSTKIELAVKLEKTK